MRLRNSRMNTLIIDQFLKIFDLDHDFEARDKKSGSLVGRHVYTHGD